MRVSYGYNLDSDIETITQNGQLATFQYDQLRRMTKRTLPNGVSTEWGFDTAGFLSTVISKLNGVAFDSHTDVPDAVGNIVQESINGAPANTFGYDDLYRLTSSSVGGVASSWVYDNNGNRTSQTVGGVVTSYTPDDANRLIAVNGVTVTNDANGNVTGDGTKTYSWDVRGRLVGLTGPGLAASFVYDYLGRRLSKTINGTATTFLNDGADVVTDTTGGVAKQTLHGPLIDEPLARDNLFFTPNHLGSTTTLTDITGVVQQSYSYSPFGETTGSGSVANPFQFTGRENDGTGLMYYRARYYRPDWGRFTSEDPIGRVGGSNLYPYAANNPLNFTDPSGYEVVPIPSPVVPVLWGVLRASGQALSGAAGVRRLRQAISDVFLNVAGSVGTSIGDICNSFRSYSGEV